MSPHSSTLAWKVPWTEEPGGQQSMWSQSVYYIYMSLSDLLQFTSVAQSCLTLCDPMNHSTPLQYSCLENPMEGGAW